MCDLNIIVYENSAKTPEHDVLGCMKKAFQLGYNTLALNVIITDEELVAKKPFPSPITYEIPDVSAKEARAQGRFLKVLTRLSAKVSESAHVHKLCQSPITAEYDLLAACPTADTVLNSIISHGAVDIIYYPLNESCRWARPATLAYAVKRGIHFEFAYTSLMGKSRLNALQNMLKVTQRNMSAGLFFSSTTSSPELIRAPLDVSFLGHLLYLKADQSRRMVWDTPAQVILHAETRRRKDRGVVLAQFQKNIPQGEKWIIEACGSAEETSNPTKRKAEDSDDD